MFSFLFGQNSSHPILDPCGASNFLQLPQDGVLFREAYHRNLQLHAVSQVAGHAALAFASALGSRIPLSSV